MRYARARDILPAELLEKIQNYVDGAYLYVPRREENRLAWGARTHSKSETAARNRAIYEKAQAGETVPDLAQEFFLTEKTLRRIILTEKRRNAPKEDRQA